MKIDIVYTWVDGSDPDWNRRRVEKAKSVGKILADSNSEARFKDNNELLFSIRSLNQFAPWINNIFIVTDNQVPDWLNTNHSKIHIVDHKDIFNDCSTLPTYSARGIESQLHHIKDLSEHFIYFNDDMFLGRETTPDHFFISSKRCRVFVSEVIPIPNKKAFDISLRPELRRNDHQHAIVNTRKLVRERFNKSVYYNIRHGAKPLLRSVLYELEEQFKTEISKTSKNSFRTNNDILFLHLFEYYSLIKGIGKPKYLKTTSSGSSSGIIPVSKSKFTFGYINLHEKDVSEKLRNIKSNKPFMICLNHTPKTPTENLEKIKSFLEEYYPKKSPFEK